jgi:urease accessory protein
MHRLAGKGRPHLFTDMRRGAGIEDVVAFIEETGGLRAATAAQ